MDEQMQNNSQETNNQSFKPLDQILKERQDIGTQMFKAAPEQRVAPIVMTEEKAKAEAEARNRILAQRQQINQKQKERFEKDKETMAASENVERFVSNPTLVSTVASGKFQVNPKDLLTGKAMSVDEMQQYQQRLAKGGREAMQAYLELSAPKVKNDIDLKAEANKQENIERLKSSVSDNDFLKHTNLKLYQQQIDRDNEEQSFFSEPKNVSGQESNALSLMGLTGVAVKGFNVLGNLFDNRISPVIRKDGKIDPELKAQALVGGLNNPYSVYYKKGAEQRVNPNSLAVVTDGLVADKIEQHNKTKSEWQQISDAVQTGARYGLGNVSKYTSSPLAEYSSAVVRGAMTTASFVDAALNGTVFRATGFDSNAFFDALERNQKVIDKFAPASPEFKDKNILDEAAIMLGEFKAGGEVAKVLPFAGNLTRARNAKLVGLLSSEAKPMNALTALYLRGYSSTPVKYATKYLDNFVNMNIAGTPVVYTNAYAANRMQGDSREEASKKALIESQVLAGTMSVFGTLLHGEPHGDVVKTMLGKPEVKNWVGKRVEKINQAFNSVGISTPAKIAQKTAMGSLEFSMFDSYMEYRRQKEEHNKLIENGQIPENTPFKMNPEKLLIAAKHGAMMGGLVGAIGVIKDGNTDFLQGDAVALAIKDPDQFKLSIQRGLDNGYLTAESAKQLISFVDAVKPHYNALNGATVSVVRKGEVVGSVLLDENTKVALAVKQAKLSEVKNALDLYQNKTYNYNESKIIKLQIEAANIENDINKLVAGTSVKGRLFTPKDVAKMAKDYTERGMLEKQRDELKANGAYKAETVDLEQFKTDEDVKAYLAVKENSEAAQEFKTQLDEIETKLAKISAAEKLGKKLSLREQSEKESLMDERAKLKADNALFAKHLDILDFSDPHNLAPVIGKDGNIIDGKKRIAAAIAKGDKNIEVLRPLTEAEHAEMLNKREEDVFGANEPNYEGLDVEDAARLRAARAAYDNAGGRAAGVAAAKESLRKGEKLYETEEPTQTKPASEAAADIEARRVEKLNNAFLEQEEYINNFKKLLKYGKTVREAFNNLFDIQRNKVKDSEEGKLFDYINNYINPDAVRVNSDTEENVQDYINEGIENLQKAKNSKRPDSRVNKINAEHDGLYLKAVEDGKMSREEAMQALEKAGRKDSEAYRQIEATEPTQTKPASEAAADIERRRQEELLSFLPTGLKSLFNKVIKIFVDKNLKNTASYRKIKRNGILSEDVVLSTSGNYSDLLHELIHKLIDGKFDTDTILKFRSRVTNLLNRISELSEGNSPVGKVLKEYIGVGHLIEEELVTWYLTDHEFRNEIDSLEENVKNKVISLVKEISGFTDSQIEEVINFDNSEKSQERASENIDKINAEHDGLYLKAVEDGKMSREEAMQALEKAGRKDSEAYRQIEATEPTQATEEPTQTKPEEPITEEKLTDLLGRVSPEVVNPVLAEAAAKMDMPVPEVKPVQTFKPNKILKGINDTIHKIATKLRGSRPAPRLVLSVSVDDAKRIADAYEEMKHDPNNPEVKRGFEELVTEIKKQADALLADGYTFELTTKGEGYGSNSEKTFKDVKENKRILVESSEESFGTDRKFDKDNIGLMDSGYKDVNGRPLTNVELIRGVHDLFGHSEYGNGFGAIGEENAWRIHMSMFSPLAQKALTATTRGQNSWVNFGKHMRNADGSIKKKGDEGYMDAASRPFAEQKIGFLPDWATDNAYGDVVELNGKEVKPVNKFVVDGKAMYDIDDPVAFRDALIAAKENRKANGKNDWIQVHAKTEKEYEELLKQGGHLLVSKDGKVGIAVGADGFVGSGFAHVDAPKGALAPLLNMAIKLGARYTDAFDTYLPEYYAKFGFKASGRMKFDEAMAEEGWSDTILKDKPDVVFMYYDGGDRMTIDKRFGEFEEYSKTDGEYVNSYDEGVAQSKLVSDNIEPEASLLPVEPETKPVSETEALSPKNMKDLYNINRELFGLNRVKALASAAVMDRMIGAMAKRAGISKADMYSKLEFRKASEQDLPQGVKLQVDAWHGSPYQFDKFTTEKIGTGEGAQAFGWGLYFTDLESIAKNYANKLAKNVDNEISEWLESDAAKGDFGEAVGEIYSKLGLMGLREEIDRAKVKLYKDERGEFYGVKFNNVLLVGRYVDIDSNAKETVERLAQRYLAKLKQITANDGATVYKVSIHKGKTPDQYNWLEWDKPLSEKQIDKIIAGLPTNPAVKNKVENFKIRIKDSKFNIGSEAYKMLSDIFNSDKKASLFLLSAGIDGIKYPAESISRGATSDTARGFNYVVFDENAVSIEEVIKFQKDAEKARGAMMISMDGQAVIYALTDPNVSTPVHELAHVFEHYLTDTERAVVQSWAGTEAWTTKTSESFARGFEKYLADGKAPSSTLQKVFDKFKEWLTDIYNGVKGSDIDLELNDQMRELYSKMVESKDVDSLFSEKGSTFDPKAEYEASFEGKASSRAIREAKMPFIDKYFKSIVEQLEKAKKITKSGCP